MRSGHFFAAPELLLQSVVVTGKRRRRMLKRLAQGLELGHSEHVLNHVDELEDACEDYMRAVAQ